MKNYRITVNGVEYEVSVEELGEGAAAASAPAGSPAPVVKAPVAKKPEAKKTGSAEGAVKVNAPMPGKILAVKISEGETINKGDVVVVLEAMKMENEIYASESGVVASVNVSVGDMVEGGDVLATIN